MSIKKWLTFDQFANNFSGIVVKLQFPNKRKSSWWVEELLLTAPNAFSWICESWWLFWRSTVLSFVKLQKAQSSILWIFDLWAWKIEYLILFLNASLWIEVMEVKLRSREMRFGKSFIDFGIWVNGFDHKKRCVKFLKINFFLFRFSQIKANLEKKEFYFKLKYIYYNRCKKIT